MTTTYTDTFTLTHAKHLASKVVADLYQCYLLYDEPSVTPIADYQEELAILLAGGHIQSYEFGFRRNGQCVLGWSYSVGADGGLSGDGNSGGLVSGVDVSGASYFNFLTPSDSWDRLTPAEREKIEASLPFQRATGMAPAHGNGYWTADRNYAAGGVAVERSVFRSW